MDDFFIAESNVCLEPVFDNLDGEKFKSECESTKTYRSCSKIKTNIQILYNIYHLLSMD